MDNKLKLVIFDLDGTLLDTLQDLTDAVNHALTEHHFPTHSLENVRSFVGNGIRKLVERAVPPGTKSEYADDVYRSFMAYYPAHCADATKPYPGITELLKALKEEGIHVAVNSNKSDAEARKLVAHYFGDLIQCCAGTLENVPKKPAPDGARHIMAHFRVSPGETLYVGDSEVDAQTALNAHAGSILVDWGFRDRAFLEEKAALLLQQHPAAPGIAILSTWQQVLQKIHTAE